MADTKLLDKYSRLITAVLSVVLGILSFLYYQPILFSVFLFIVVVMILRYFKLINLDSNLLLALVLALFVPLLSQSLPDSSQFIAIFTPLTVGFYLVITHFTTNRFMYLSEKYLVKKSKKSKTSIKTLRKLLFHDFYFLSSLLYFVITSAVIGILPILFFKTTLESKPLYELISDALSKIFLNWRFWVPVLVGLLIIGICFWLTIRKKKGFKLLSPAVLYLLLTLLICLTIVIPFLLIPAFYTMLASYSQTSIIHNFEVCQFNHTTFISSYINTFPTVCYQRVFHQNPADGIFSVKYDIIFPNDKKIDYFVLNTTNQTYQYLVVCSNLIYNSSVLPC